MDLKYSKLEKVRLYRYRTLLAGASAFIATLSITNNYGFHFIDVGITASIFVTALGISGYLEHLKEKDGKIKFNQEDFYDIRSRMNEDYLKNLLDSNKELIKEKLI